MSPKLKTFLTGLLFSLLWAGTGVLWADPSQNVVPDQPIYQRVKKLGDLGLLDPGDRAVLDQGLAVTRLELAFYVEKAKSKLAEKSVPAATTPGSAGTPVIPSAKAPSNPTLAAQIDDLLKQLDEESDYLSTRLALDDYRLRQQEDELQKLNDVQDEVNAAFRRSNKSNGTPHFNYVADERIENLHLSGITVVNATRVVNEMNLGVWSDLGGKGSFSMGVNGYLPSSNASAAPASIAIISPNVNFSLDGLLGHWNNTLAVEDYTGDTDLGDFTRGQPPGTLRFEDPFDIKKYSGDKNLKNWDDYMTNLGYVPSSVSWISQNNSARVFDGLYMIGTQLPLVSKDAKATILVGRTDSAQRWEEGLKYSQPFGGGVQATFSSLWVNDNFGVAPTAANGAPATGVMDMKSYAADFGIDLKPFFLELEGGFSHFYTGIVNNGSVTAILPNGQAARALEAPAGQLSLNFYPLTLYYTAISDEYANFQSKVILSGLPFWQYGVLSSGNNTPPPNDQFGFVGMVDDLISNRHGWRANLGWKGRQESWTQSLPGFLDDILVNFDVAQKTEYRSAPDELGYDDVEADNLITVYYPEDTGIWGGSVWDGYSGVHPAGQAYAANIEDIRNDGNANANNGGSMNVNYVIRGLVGERVPLMLAAANEPIQDINGKPVTLGPGQNTYTNLSLLKTFNYVTLTTKLQLNKMLGMANPLYGSFFFTDNRVSGTTTDPILSVLPDPNRPGQTLANVPELFDQTVYDMALMVGVVKNIDLMADYGLEYWKSDYTYPLVDYRTDSVGLGAAYDLPWGGGKLELRYKHIVFQDRYVSLNSYQADQFYSYFLFSF